MEELIKTEHGYKTEDGKVTIIEDYCVKTKEEQDQILKNLADIYINHLKKKMGLEIFNHGNS